MLAPGPGGAWLGGVGGLQVPQCLKVRPEVQLHEKVVDHGLVHQGDAGGRDLALLTVGGQSRVGRGGRRGSGGTHWAASGAVTECFMSTGSGSSSLSCTALSSASDGTPASSGRAKARGSPWCRRRATGGSAVG